MDQYYSILEERKVLMIHTDKKDRTVWSNMKSNRIKATYTSKQRVSQVKYGTSKNKNSGFGRLPTITKTETTLLGSHKKQS